MDLYSKYFGIHMFFFSSRLIEPLNLEKAVDLYQKAAGVFEVNLSLQSAKKYCTRVTDF